MSSPGVHTSSTSRRAQFLNFAAKKFPINATPRSKKGSKIPLSQRTNVKVSSPLDNYNRRKSSLNLATPVRHTTEPPEPVKKYPAESIFVEKPLPNLPFATIGSKSPVNRRSLIDATERPLQYGLSASVVENWPALSPLKPSKSVKRTPSTPADQQKQPVVQAIKPSLGESFIAGMQRLSIDEGPSSPPTRAVKSSSTQSPATPSTPQTSPQPPPESADLTYLHPRPAPDVPLSHLRSPRGSSEDGSPEYVRQQPNIFAEISANLAQGSESFVRHSASANTSHPRTPRLALPAFKFPSTEDRSDAPHKSIVFEHDDSPTQLVLDALVRGRDDHDEMIEQDDNAVEGEPGPSEADTHSDHNLPDGADLKSSSGSDCVRGPQVRKSSVADYYILGKGEQPLDDASSTEEELFHCQPLSISKTGAVRKDQYNNTGAKDKSSSEAPTKSEPRSASPSWLRTTNQADRRPVTRASTSYILSSHKPTVEFAATKNLKRLSSNPLLQNTPPAKALRLDNGSVQTPTSPDWAVWDRVNPEGQVASSPTSAYSLRHALQECPSEQAGSIGLPSSSLPVKNMKKRRSQLFPTRSSSRQGEISRLTGLRRSTPQATKPSQHGGQTGNDSPVLPSHKHMLTYAQSMQALSAHGGENKLPSSPLPTGKTVTTGKAMIHNIKGLFNNARHADEVHTPPAKGTHRPSISRPMPAAAIPDNEKYASRLRPSKSTRQDQQHKRNSTPKRRASTNQEAIPKIMTSALESGEIQHAQALAFELLSHARKMVDETRKQQVMDLAKTLSNVVKMAREAEISLELSRQATMEAQKASVKAQQEATKAELSCVMIKQEIVTATAGVAAITMGMK